MIKNGEIRKYVTERIKPFRGKLLGYGLVYSLLVGLLSATILSAVYFFVTLIFGAIVTVSGVVLGFDGGLQTIINMLSQSILSIVEVLLGVVIFALSIGFMKEILLSVNEKDNVTPIDFFRFGFEKFKKLTGIYFRLVLRYLPFALFMVVGMVLFLIDFIYLLAGGSEALAIILLIISLLLFIIGTICYLIVFIRYQSIAYDYIYDDKDLSAKELIKKSRESIKGYRFQWFRMSLIYYVIAILAVMGIECVASLLIGLSAGIIGAQNAITTILSVILMMLAIVLIFGGVIAVAIIMNYFGAKRILNLNELYKLIQKEKANQVL